MGEGSHRTNHKGDNEIDKHSEEANTLWRNTKPIVLTVGKELEVDNISQSKSNSTDHSGYGSLFVYFLEKIPIIKVGKKEEAASPKAKATVLATKLDGGLIPK